ncbi:MAG TPA: hypothetical protein VH085_14250 [Nocardioides sp.]|nr:hypothetical protein [Nocardioides sp.]
MFIQVIKAKTSRAAEVRALSETWREGEGAGAVGWLGGTFGVTEAGDFLAVIRFSSREDAMANSARPETGEFSGKLGALMDSAPEFYDCDDVTTFLAGGSDDAGFVQVIEGHTDDAGPMKAMAADTGDLEAMRPEIVGGTFALGADGTFFQTIYFTDEASARQGEGIEPPTEVRDALAAVMAGASFHDLREPWFESP